MPAYAQIPPATMRRMLLVDGWAAKKRTEFHWIMQKTERIVVIPRKCRTLPFAIFNDLLIETGLEGRYLELLDLATRPVKLRQTKAETTLRPA